MVFFDFNMCGTDVPEGEDTDEARNSDFKYLERLALRSWRRFDVKPLRPELRKIEAPWAKALMKAMRIKTYGGGTGCLRASGFYERPRRRNGCAA